jgi:hypothetical protein
MKSALFVHFCLALALGQSDPYGDREIIKVSCKIAPSWTVGWTGTGPNPKAIAIADPSGVGSHCLDIQRMEHTFGSHVWLWPCSTLGAGDNEKWLSNGSTLKSQQNGTDACFGINSTGFPMLANCSSTEAVMKMSGKSGPITTGDGKCLAMSGPPTPGPTPVPDHR